MKIKLLIVGLLLVACNNEHGRPASKMDTIATTPDTSLVAKEPKDEPVMPASKTYANERFKDVSVERIDEAKFRIRGLGQIFESNFGWVVEDGHEELGKGFEMTDAGAPAWGKFDFTLEVQKKRENSTLMLILFESSPKDGSRQYELPVVLY